jgi:hypothetical protein
MDPAGLAVSLIGLASLFTTCIECFDYFHAGKNIDKYFPNLLVKLDLKKAQLLIWGNASGISEIEKEKRHPRLADPATFELVEKALKAIHRLLEHPLRAQFRRRHWQKRRRWRTWTGKRISKRHQLKQHERISNNLETVLRKIFSRSLWTGYIKENKMGNPRQREVCMPLGSSFGLYERSAKSYTCAG